MGYRIRRVDENQKDIVKLFRGLGASVLILSEVGKGCPDILIGIFGKNYLIECKSSDKAKLTYHEKNFFNKWKGQVCVINSEIDAINFINEERMKNG